MGGSDHLDINKDISQNKKATLMTSQVYSQRDKHHNTMGKEHSNEQLRIS